MINEIDDDITFDDRDEFGRKVIAEKVISLLVSDTEVSPMIIDGSWGTGKTEFCKKLINLIKENNAEYSVAYIDAFRYDNNSEPLLAVLSAIIKVLPETEQSSLKEKALPAIKFGLKTTLKAGVSWILKQDATDIVDDFEEDLKNAGDAAVSHAVETILKDHVESQDNIDLLIESLTEVTREKPIIIVIDELDRCRPDYSVSMLEYIKHIFNIENIQFLLVTNTEQLKSSVNHSYGVSINAQKYLDKFISYSFSLPQIINLQAHNENHVSIVHMQGLLNSSTVLNESMLNERGIDQLIETLIKVNNLSLREVETFVRYLEIYNTITERRGFNQRLIYGYRLLRILGVFIFCFHNDKSEELSNGRVDCLFLSNLIGKSSLPTTEEDRHVNIFDILVAIFSSESNSQDSRFRDSYENNMNLWEKRIGSLFQSGGFPPERGERLKIITSTIHTLKLSS